MSRPYCNIFSNVFRRPGPRRDCRRNGPGVDDGDQTEPTAADHHKTRAQHTPSNIGLETRAWYTLILSVHVTKASVHVDPVIVNVVKTNWWLLLVASVETTSRSDS